MFVIPWPASPAFSIQILLLCTFMHKTFNFHSTDSPLSPHSVGNSHWDLVLLLYNSFFLLVLASSHTSPTNRFSLLSLQSLFTQRKQFLYRVKREYRFDQKIHNTVITNHWEDSDVQQFPLAICLRFQLCLLLYYKFIASVEVEAENTTDRRVIELFSQYWYTPRIYASYEKP